MIKSSPPPTSGAHAVELLTRLIAAQADGETAVQTVIADALDDAGCEVSELRFEPADVPALGEFATAGAQATGERTAVIGRLPASDDSLASLLMFAHPDAEPLAGTDRWSHDPFAGTIADRRLYGWGVADDLAGCAAALAAMRKLAGTGARHGALSFASTPSKRSARGVAAVLHNGHAADAALYLHPAESGAGMREVKTVTSGMLEFRIEVRGRLPETEEPSHTAFTHLAINPVDKLVPLHGALRKLSDDLAARLRHPLIEARVGRAANLQIASLACGDPMTYGRLGETLEIGCALSFPPGADMRALMAEVEATVAAVAAGDDWLRAHPPGVHWLTGVTGAEVTVDHPLWLVTEAAVHRTTGTGPVVNPMHTSSDIRVPAVEAGIPCVGLGCLAGDLTQNGRHDEWVDLDDFVRMTDVTAAIAADWCARPAEPRRTGPNRA